MKETSGWVHTVLLWSAVVCLLTGCERGSLKEICPSSVTTGQLIFSELRGVQTGADTWGQWIEIHNTTDTAVNVAGLKVRLRKLDGGSEVMMVVRDHGITVDPRGYFVLGHFPHTTESRPLHVNYGYDTDFTSDMYTDGVLEVYSCGTLVDQIVYHGLPKTGSLAFDGNLELTAAANDDENLWCVDDTEPDPGGGEVTDVGTPGTPGEKNRPCN